MTGLPREAATRDAAIPHQAAADTPPAGRPVDNLIWAALNGPHRRFAEFAAGGRAARYQQDVAPFVGLADDPDDTAWADLAGLVGPRARIAIGGVADRTPPDGWDVVWRGAGVQMIGVSAEVAPGAETSDAETSDPEALVLGAADVPEMLALVARTQPGPFRPRTHELGTYLGIRRAGELVAMAGERLHLPGWTEISAVCTDAAHRRQGLAGRLVRAVAAGIRARGETPFLHAVATNTTAIRLYEDLGFVVSRTVEFVSVLSPG